MEKDKTCKSKHSVLGAKTLSKFTMLFSGLWIVTLTILKGLNIINLTENEIISSSIAISAVWTPTYFSIFIDKFKSISIGE